MFHLPEESITIIAQRKISKIIKVVSPSSSSIFNLTPLSNQVRECPGSSTDLSLLSGDLVHASQDFSSTGSLSTL